MGWDPHLYAVPLALAGVSLAAFAVYFLLLARERSGPKTGAWIAAALVGSGAIWVLAHALQVVYAAPAGSVFLLKMEYVGTVPLPILWFAYVCWYTGRTDWLTATVFAPLGAIATLFLFLISLNEVHWLFWTGFTFASESPHTIAVEWGPLFWLYLSFVTVLLATATAFLVSAVLSTRGVLRKQVATLFVFSLSPAVVGGIYLLGPVPTPGVNVAALSTVLVVVAAAASVFRYRWFDLTPVGRGDVVDSMAEAMIVVNDRYDVVDYNDAADELFASSQLVGTSLSALSPPLVDVVEAIVEDEFSDLVADERSSGGDSTGSPDQSDLLSALESDGWISTDRREITLETPSGSRTFAVTVTSPDRHRGFLILLHDITDRTRAETALARRRHMAEALLGVTHDLASADEREAVCDRAVEGAVSILEVEHARLFLASDGELEVTAETGQWDGPLTGAVSSGIARRVFSAGQAHVVDDLTIRGAAAEGGADAWLSAVESADGSRAGVDAVGSTLQADITPDTARTPGSGAHGQAQSSTDGGGTGVKSGGSLDDLFEWVDDGTADPRRNDPLIEDLFASVITVPIDDLGVLQVFATERGAFDQEDAEVLSLLGSHTKIALDRADTATELRRERDRLEEFASVVSHDLRNPLSVADGYLDLVREDPDPEHFERIERAHDKMERLIDDLLTLARHGEVVGETELIDLESLVERSWETIGSPEATLSVPGSLGEVDADRERLEDLFANLFRNAVEHGGEDVTVRVGRTEDRIYVADDGPGIPPEEREDVFDQGYTTSSEGTGFGLAIVQRIAEAHGWDVAMTESRDGGARVEILIS
ncbi:Signal transduction histidine kinase [Halalkaliarchaeum sp. AArc-CO]|uniref:sensor histidine kinase n=1 Tax=Halalkaliarchaeum sp. AArc-CO TaxID=2866381 RepID=UPI00217EF3B7|nr:histidine kinase N-terminal 7TM domain-containing protein [Halalkaliarchaeum sp. AArc-CO]UWG51818.1 Signal transduction histidine kinase [Halalkaliarchaeum sp. AArc-CO]